MSVTLSQSNLAAFPDRPANTSGIGLSIAMIAGNDGAYLAHDLKAAPDPLHLRLMLRNESGIGGEVVIARGMDANDVENFRIVLDLDANTIAFELSTGETLSSPLITPIAWQCIEVMIDRNAGKISLLINGRLRNEATGIFTTLQPQIIQLGCIFKDTAAAGDLFMDEVLIDDSEIGPVVVESQSDFADDPARWLVIFNENSEDSAIFAETYRAARNIPFANLLGLDLSTNETIDNAGFIALHDAIEDYMSRHALNDQIIGLLFGHGVPGIVDVSGLGDLHCIASMLMTSDTAPGVTFNPLFVDGEPARPWKESLSGIRLTARIDGPTLEASTNLIGRATQLMTNGLGDGSSSTIYLDPWTAPDAQKDLRMAAMFDWSQSIDRQLTRLPIALSSETKPQSEVQFSSINKDGFFWGWEQSTPTLGFFDEPVGSRIFALQLANSVPSADTLRNATPMNWVQTAIDAGYTSVAGSIDVFSLSSIPAIHPFFAALRLGWTLAEAWFVSLPMIRDAIHLVGDPLLSLQLPRAGWNVFGPLESLEHLDGFAPRAALRENEYSLDLSDEMKPNDGEMAIYAVRHVDTFGRSEQGAAHARVKRINDDLLPLPAQPTWPTALNWPVMIEGGEAWLTTAWDQPARALGVTVIELYAREVGGSPIIIDSHTPRVGQMHHVFMQSLPVFETQYRLRCLNEHDMSFDSPWSTVVVANSSSPIALEILE